MELCTIIVGKTALMFRSNVALKSGTAQIADEKNGVSYRFNQYIFSVVSMHPAEDPDFILYVTVQQPEHYSGISLGSLPINP